MPRRIWRKPPDEVLNEHLKNYPCPLNCSAHNKVLELFGVLTYDLASEQRKNGTQPPLRQQMVNGHQMRALIADFVSYLRDGIGSGKIKQYPNLYRDYKKNKGEFIGLALGCLCDLCFNMEYVRRISDHRWAYCNEHGAPRAFYPYLGVCPQCILTADKPHKAALGTIARSDTYSEEDVESRARYFGNKIESHHVGRIGERAFAFILDLVVKAHDPNAIIGLVFDDQHEVDAICISQGVMALAQIKASPLVLLPAIVDLSKPLTEGSLERTGLPAPKRSHTFTDIQTAEYDIGLYIPLSNAKIPLGAKRDDDFPYATFRQQLNVEVTLQLLDNWLEIFRSFEIPKKQRRGDHIRRAYLTCGWGSPIDDNKTKAGLARSDNMMKGTYASLKYGAYYSAECIRRTIRSGLFANIDPAHQYADYLEKLEDIRWGHGQDFKELKSRGASRQVIDSDNLIYLFDSVFTFNRQILNDSDMRRLWRLDSFVDKLLKGRLDDILANWQQA